MIARLSAGWQTTIADLALILFMVTAAGLNGQRQREASPSASPEGEPLAVYRAHAAGPPLGQWLAEQAPDPRQYLTIVARYPPGAAEAASRKALELAREAGAAGVSARIVLEPGADELLLATLAFDRPDPVARSLQRTAEQ